MKQSIRITPEDVAQAQEEADEASASATTPAQRIAALQAHAFALDLLSRRRRQNVLDAALALGGTVVPGRVRR